MKYLYIANVYKAIIELMKSPFAIDLVCLAHNVEFVYQVERYIDLGCFDRKFNYLQRL